MYSKGLKKRRNRWSMVLPFSINVTITFMQRSYNVSLIANLRYRTFVTKLSLWIKPHIYIVLTVFIHCKARISCVSIPWVHFWRCIVSGLHLQACPRCLWWETVTDGLLQTTEDSGFSDTLNGSVNATKYTYTRFTTYQLRSERPKMVELAYVYGEETQVACGILNFPSREILYQRQCMQKMIRQNRCIQYQHGMTIPRVRSLHYQQWRTIRQDWSIHDK